MSLRIDRLSPSNLLVSQDVSSKNNIQTREIKSNFRDDEYIEEEDEYPQDLEIGFTQPINSQSIEEEITLEELINRLEAISKEKLKPTIGFHPSPKTKEDILLGKEADKLTNALIKKQKKQTIKLALEFMGRVNLIEELKNISKERGQEIGLLGDTKPNEDQELSKKASQLASLLVYEPSPQVIKAAVKFLEVVEIINTLEEVQKEKNKSTGMGFHSTAKSEEEINIGESASLLALVLKKKPIKQNIQAAIEFLELTQMYDTARFMREKKKRQNPCFGYHCTQNNKKKSLQRAA